MFVYRKELWFSLAISSAVVLTSLVQLNDDGGEWILIVFTALSLLFSIAWTTIYTMTWFEKYRVGKPELFSLLCILIVWTVFISTKFTSKGGGMDLIVLEDGSDILIVSNGNEYLFGWLSIVICLLLDLSYIQIILDIDVAEATTTLATRFIMWFFLFFCSLVVLTATSSTLNDTDCTAKNRLCRNTWIGIGISTCSFLLSLSALALKIKRDPKLMHIADNFFPFLICLGYVLTMYFIVGPHSPGEPTSNTFYFSWFSLLISFFLCYRSRESLPVLPIVGKKLGKNTPAAEQESTKSEIPTKKKIIATLEEEDIPVKFVESDEESPGSIPSDIHIQGSFEEDREVKPKNPKEKPKVEIDGVRAKKSRTKKQAKDKMKHTSKTKSEARNSSRKTKKFTENEEIKTRQESQQVKHTSTAERTFKPEENGPDLAPLPDTVSLLSLDGKASEDEFVPYARKRPSKMRGGKIESKNRSVISSINKLAGLPSEIKSAEVPTQEDEVPVKEIEIPNDVEEGEAKMMEPAYEIKVLEGHSSFGETSQSFSRNF